MNYTNKLYQKNPYTLTQREKNKIFLTEISKLTRYHYKNCKLYKKIIKNLKFKFKKNNKIENFPMLPARIFKKFDLKSIPDNKIFKKLLSSGTSKQQLSKIYLDKNNAKNQTKVLGKIMETILGNQRLPMLIIDQSPKILDRSTFNAKAAAIYGFSLFGKNYCYLLNSEKKIDYTILNTFLKKFGNEKFFVFGFTSMIFEYLIQKLAIKKVNISFEKGNYAARRRLEKIRKRKN